MIVWCLGIDCYILAAAVKAITVIIWWLTRV